MLHERAVESKLGAEKSRSILRHDLRTNFNVIIGYCEMCIEEIAEIDANDNRLPVFESLLSEIRILLRETEYALESVTLESDELFRDEISRWLKKALVPSIQKIVFKKEQQLSSEAGYSNLGNLDDAFKKLTQRCLNPFADSRLLSRPEVVSFRSGENADSIGHVLVIDDQADNLVLIKHRLEKLGLSVEAMTSAVSALVILSDKEFDAILVDLDMPEMSGLDFLKELKSRNLLADIPTLIVTASDELDLISECITLGAVDFLPKPFDNSILMARIGATIERKKSRDREKQMSRELHLEKSLVDDLLAMLLPIETLNELKQTGRVKPRRFSNVSVMFCDVVDFTTYCESHDPEIVLENLHSIFSEFDAIVEMHGVQKIKTIGDCYMAACGMNGSREESFHKALASAFAMIEATRNHRSGWKVRIGIHVGDVIGGIAGTRNYLFDLWGDVVNTAARLQSVGAPMTVTVINDNQLPLPKWVQSEELGKVDLKGKGVYSVATLQMNK
ncbi:MAG: adenylate/guanylate cyclase domain-containing protein [Silvanigrellaceae bacterium]